MWIEIQSVMIDIGSIRMDIQCNVGIWTGQDTVDTRSVRMEL
jgi:hypothetical protein